MSVPTSDITEPAVDDFDAEKAVWDYRRVMAKLERARTPQIKAQYRSVAKAMRKAWADWQGEDLLYEMAFGESWN
jgi:hypothetical protein